MSQTNQMVTVDEGQNKEDVRQQMRTTHGHERRTLDAASDDHPLAGMDSERQAPIESVAKNVVRRYDVKKAAFREYLSNAHTAEIQRAKWMLAEHGDISDVDMTSVRDVLDAANEQFGYEPVITVKYNKDPNSRWTLKIEDNGIGIDSQTAYAIRDIGLSGWHMDGSTNGQFGQGTMSGFLLSGMYGEFHMVTKSAVTGENYRAAWKLTDLNKLKGERDSIGTTFTWPTFTDEAQDIDVYEAVREYAEGMVVPVIYEEYDEGGNQDGVRSDDFVPSYMEDRYPDDAMVVTYEDQFGKAVWSPSDPEGWNSSVNTFCGYQPIKRNEPDYGTHKKYDMPGAFDFRLKVEDGSIISVGEGEDGGSMDHPLVGKTPVSCQKYRSMLLSERSVAPESHVDDADAGYIAPEDSDFDFVTTDEHVADQIGGVGHVEDSAGLTRAVITGKYEGRAIIPDDEWDEMDDGRIGEEFVPRDEIDDDLDVLVAMEPTDDRDRFEQKHVTTVLQRYSEKLYDQLQEYTADVFRQVDEFEDIFDLEGNEQALFHNGVSRFGPKYAKSEPETVQETIEDKLGVTLSTGVCEKIDVMKKKVSLAPRDAHRPQKKSNRHKKPVWKVMRLAQDGDKDGDVYMGWRISENKARLAWELDEANQVVQTTKRELFAERLGWKDLTDLPTRQFEKHFDHDFEDDFLDSWDKERANDTSSSSGSSGLGDDVKSLSYNDKRAQKRDVTVRQGSGDPAMMSDMNGEALFNAIHDSGSPSYASSTDEQSESDNDEDGGQYKGRYEVQKLILYRETDHGKGVGKRFADKHGGILYAVVPNYVYDYLIKADGSYTEQEYLDTLTDEWIDFDWTPGQRAGRTLEDADERDVLVMGQQEDLAPYEEFAERSVGDTADEQSESEYDVMAEFRDQIQSALRDKDVLKDTQDIRSITFREELTEYKPVLSSKGVYDLDPDEGRPFIVSFTKSSGYGFPTDASVDRRTTFLDCVLGDLDRTAPEWDRFSVDINDTEMIETMRRLQDAGGFVSTDDDFELSVPTDDRLDLTNTRYGDVEIHVTDVLVTKTLERLEDAGGFVSSDDEDEEGDDE